MADRAAVALGVHPCPSGRSNPWVCKQAALAAPQHCLNHSSIPHLSLHCRGGQTAPPSQAASFSPPCSLFLAPLPQGAGPALKKDTAFSKAGRQNIYLQYTATGRNSSFSIYLYLHIRDLCWVFSPQTHCGWLFCNKLGEKKGPYLFTSLWKDLSWY